jgi:hypothetical protein
MRKEGIANWNALAWAKSLATRRANGSVWGWNNRTRADNIDKNTVAVASSALPSSPPSLRARTAEDEMSFVDEEEYQSYLDSLESEQRFKDAAEMGMMMAVGAPGFTRAAKVRMATRKTVSAMSDTLSPGSLLRREYGLPASNFLHPDEEPRER